VDNATRKTEPSLTCCTQLPISTNNDVEGLKFEMPSGYFPSQQDRRWSFSGEFGRFSGWNGAVFHDKDGFDRRCARFYIVIDNGIADDPEHCQIKRIGTLPCVRVIWGACRLAPAVPEVVVDLARCRSCRSGRPGAAGGRGVAGALGGPGGKVPLLHRSLSAAMVESSTSAGTPRYSPVPRSGRKRSAGPEH